MDNNSGLKGIDFSPEINMARYLQKIRSYPILSQDEEYDLAVKYKETKNQEIAKILVNSHLRLVVKVASKYRGYGLSAAEMISEGNIGLLYAIEKFEPEKGFRFSTYALWWIKASIQKYILNSWSLVKIGTTAAQKKLFFNLRKIKNRLNLNDDRELTSDVLHKIAGSLDVSVQEVKDMNTRLKAHDGSLNTIIDASGDNSSEWMDFIADTKPNQEDVFAYSETMKYRKKMFLQALVVLNKREKDILKFIEKRKITSVAVGCGTGKSSSVKNLILSIIKKFDIYVTIDADGLNSLEGKQKKSTIKEFKNSKSKITVTPHPKEFERISGIKYKEDTNYRKQITKTFAKNNDIICLLKGHKTVVSDGNEIYVNNTGNAGMATAGSGDVLTGIISAFTCIENKDLLLKVSTAVYVHGLAGDFAAKEKSQISMTASDIIGNIFKAIKKITR